MEMTKGESMLHNLKTFVARAVVAVVAAVALGAPMVMMAQDNAPAENAAPANKPPDALTDEEKARAEKEAGDKPDPNKPITVDFVNREVQTVMHYIALRSGLNIILDGAINTKLTIMFRETLPRDVIRQICNANELDFIEDGNSIIIKRRKQETGLANVVKGDEAGKYHVSFEQQELVAAIMEVARVTNTQALVPTQPQPQNPTPTPTPEGEPKKTEGQEQKEGARIQSIQQRKISMYLRDADPETIMRRLAEVGDLLLREGSNPKDGYFFLYREVLDSEKGDIQAKPLVTREWVLPGVDVTQSKSELTPILSTRGRILIDKTASLIVIMDRQEVIDNADRYLSRAGAIAMEKQRAADALANDPLVIRPITITRDVGDQALQAAVTAVLSKDGKASYNPESNTVVVVERQSLMPMIEQLVRGLDGMPQQVLITARLAEVSLENYLGYGLQLFSSQPVDSWKDGIITGSSQNIGNATAGGISGVPTGFAPFVGTFVNDVIDVRLELLENDGKVRTMIAPSQLVSNKKPARIEVGQEIPYVQQSSTGTGTGTTTATVEFKEVSAIMDIIPMILDNGIVRLQITVTVREVVGVTALQGNNTPVLSKRETKSDVFLRDGETVVMGGLLRERERTDENGLPLLKDIPFLGYLFKSANKTVSKTDLMFFIRPTIVNAHGPRNELAGGIEIARDLTPAVLDPTDAEKVGMRPGSFRVPARTPKPAHYNESARPKTAADVKPGA